MARLRLAIKLFTIVTLGMIKRHETKIFVLFFLNFYTNTCNFLPHLKVLLTSIHYSLETKPFLLSLGSQPCEILTFPALNSFCFLSQILTMTTTYANQI